MNASKRASKYVAALKTENERPILFNGAMVRALLDGTKTQTRRVIIPNATRGRAVAHVASEPTGPLSEYWVEPGGWVRCPYGQPGDRLWVRETFAWLVNDDDIPVEPETFLYAATDNYEGRSTPSIHMPRRASRLTLEVTEVRVDRGMVSVDDALAEGFSGPEEFRLVFEQMYGEGAIELWRWAISFRRLP